MEEGICENTLLNIRIALPTLPSTFSSSPLFLDYDCIRGRIMVCQMGVYQYIPHTPYHTSTKREHDTSDVWIDVLTLYQDGSKMGSNIKNSYLQVSQISSYGFELHYKENECQISTIYMGKFFADGLLFYRWISLCSWTIQSPNDERRENKTMSPQFKRWLQSPSPFTRQGHHAYLLHKGIINRIRPHKIVRSQPLCFLTCAWNISTTN